MKKLVWLIAILMLISLACQALLPANQQGQHAQATKNVRSIILPAPMIPVSPAPTLEPITCTDDACLESCLQKIEAAIPQTEYEPLTSAYAGNDISMDLVYYYVKDGQLGKPQFLFHFGSR